jgi:hypothetical protein
MKNNIINLGIVRKIAKALGELNDKVAFVGGAVVSIYADDPAAEDVRPTKDVDITLEIVSFRALTVIQEELTKKGFAPGADEKIICRFKYDDILVDLMGTEEVGWVQSNKWFKPGFAHLKKVSIEGQDISVLPVSYFLATKFSAFKNRGTDARTSHDFEDITYILDNHIALIEEVLSAPNDVKTFLQEEFQLILNNKSLQEGILGNLYYQTQARRFELILNKLRRIVEGVID